MRLLRGFAEHADAIEEAISRPSQNLAAKRNVCASCMGQFDECCIYMLPCRRHACVKLTCKAGIRNTWGSWCRVLLGLKFSEMVFLIQMYRDM